MRYAIYDIAVRGCFIIIAVPSKFRRRDDSEQSEDETSEISILEEVTADSDTEAQLSADNADNVAAGSESDNEQAIPDLLQESVDITEFDEDDLLLEEEILTPQLKKMNKSEQKVTSTKKTTAERSSGSMAKMTPRNGIKPEKDRSQTRLTDLPRNGTSVRRDRSRSPLQRTNRSPQRRRERTPPLQYGGRGSNSPTKRRSPPPQYSDKITHSPSRRRSPPPRQADRMNDLRERLSVSPRPDLRNRMSPKPPEKDDRSEEQPQTSETPREDDPLNNPNISEEDKQLLLKRKEKFSKKKISSGKKTVKLKKSSTDKGSATKKKTSITKRLGAKKPKLIRVKSQSPEIVETVSLDKDQRSDEVQDEDNQLPEMPAAPVTATKSSTVASKGIYSVND